MSGWKLLVSSLLVAFLGPAALAEGATPDYSKDPVLMVHGYFLGEGPTWEWMQNRLIDNGWPSEFLYRIEFDDGVGCNPDHAHQIAGMVQLIRMQTGRDKIDLLSHSMGGLDTRYYIKYLCGYRYVKDYVSIAGAHKGTMIACADLISCGAQQMCVTSTAQDAWMSNDFLLALNSCDITPNDDILYTSIWTGTDEIIVPQVNSMIEGARNIQVNALVGHGLILLNEETLGYVMTGLNGGGLNNNIPTGTGPCYTDCTPPDWLDPGPELSPEVVEAVEPYEPEVWSDSTVDQEIIEETLDTATSEVSVDVQWVEDLAVDGSLDQASTDSTLFKDEQAPEATEETLAGDKSGAESPGEETTSNVDSAAQGDTTGDVSDYVVRKSGGCQVGHPGGLPEWMLLTLLALAGMVTLRKRRHG